MPSKNFSSRQLYLATDLDRTLFPNGEQEADDSLAELKEAVHRHQLGVIYVTGRNREQIREGINRYDPPLPEYAIAEVGTRIHQVDPASLAFDELKSYTTHLQQVSPGWERNRIESHLLKEEPRLELQSPENQNPFKISFHCRPDDLESLRMEIPKHLRALSDDFQEIFSIDETTDQGLVDILPGKANKLHALDYLRQHLALTTDQVIYAGDSGNDLEPLASHYRSILVANATDAVRQSALALSDKNGTRDSLFLAHPDQELNGYYASGILQGLRHYRVI